MRIATLRRLERLEEKHTSRLIKPWLVLNAGEPVPKPLPTEYGGLVQIVVFDARKPQENP